MSGLGGRPRWVLERSETRVQFARVDADAAARTFACYGVGWRDPKSGVRGVVVVSVEGLSGEAWRVALDSLRRGGRRALPRGVSLRVEGESQVVEVCWAPLDGCQRWGLEGVQVGLGSDGRVEHIEVALPEAWT